MFKLESFCYSKYWEILLLYNAINTEASYAICEDFILQFYVQICDRKISYFLANWFSAFLNFPLQLLDDCGDQ